MTDNELLFQKICPDCRNPINSYFINDNAPWCKACDTYFTFLGKTLLRNKNATKEYNDIYDECMKEKTL